MRVERKWIVILVGNLSGNSGLCINIILIVALLHLASKMTNYGGHLFSLSHQHPFFPGKFVMFSI